MIKFLDLYAQKINKLTVVVLDNAPIHRSLAFQKKIAEWRKKKMEIFWLPTYSPQLNLIEILWRFMKYEWIETQAYTSWKHLTQNVALANKQADQNQKVVRISIDSKARVKLGNLSREGKSRTKKALQANDHDYNCSQSLIPFGILNLTTEQLSIYFGTSSETSDFILDCLSMWWQNNRQQLVLSLMFREKLLAVSKMIEGGRK